MTAIPSQISLVNRKHELEELKNHLNKAAQGQGNLLFIAGEAGVGKTRLLDELKNYAQSQGIQILQGWSLYESLTPYMPFVEALRSANLDHLFSREEPPKVECVYLITDTGLLIKDVVREETKLDSTIFAGMLTAVGEFVRDSLSMLSGKEKKEALNSLGYQNYRILIENGQNTNLVVILTGRENEFLINDMRETLLNVEEQFGNILKVWDGDDSSVRSIDTLLKPLITSGKYDGIDYAKDDPQIKRNLLFENILLGITRHSKVNPSILCIEDLQWADPSTMALMHYVARNTRKCNLLILGTYRPEDVTATKEGKVHHLIDAMQLMSREDLYRKIELGRLEEVYIDDMHTSLLGKTNFPDEFKKQLHKETEGNPFFIVELIRMLVEEKTIERKEDIWILTKKLEEMDIPSKVHDVIERRLNRVKEDMREVLECASVIGEEFTSKLLSPVLDINRIELLKILKTLEQKHRLIRSHNGNYKFDHAKIKEVLYSEIPAELKMEYHALIADTIETLSKDDLEEVIEDLAFHYCHCRNRDKALPYLIKAAEKAKKEYSNEEAIRFYNQALDLEKDLNKRLKMIETMAEIYELMGNYNKCLESYKNALQLTDDKNKIAEIKGKIGHIYHFMGEYNKSLCICNEALELVEEENKTLALILNAMGRVNWTTGIYDKSFECFEKSLEIMKNIGDQKGIASSLSSLGAVNLHIGEYDKSLKSLKLSLNIMEEIGDRIEVSKCLNNIGLVLMLKGEYDKAYLMFEECKKISEITGFQRVSGYALHNIGEIYKHKEKYNMALKYYEKSHEKFEKLGEQRGLTLNYIGMAETYTKKGELDIAMDFCNRAIDLSLKIGEKENTAHIKKVFGMIYREQKKWKESIQNFQEGITILEGIGAKKGLGYHIYEFGLMWKKKGDAVEAKKYLNNALEIFKKLKYKDYTERVLNELKSLYEIND